MEPFRVHILGCGSALPTLRHFPSAQIVECRGKLFMVDCGEGTQIQLRHCRVRFTKISAVFISHLHGDHCLGLPGMLSTFGLLGRTARISVYAPAGLEPVLKAQMSLVCPGLEYEIDFHAIDTTRLATIYEDRSLSVSTIPLDHRVECCGFLFREKPGLAHIRRDMADFYGVPVSQYNNIKAGADWTAPDGSIVEHSRLTTPPDQPRSYAYCCDTRYMPSLHKLLKDVDTIYHDSTYGDDNIMRAEKYYHSTARQAAQVALDAEAKQLILGHYSSRYEDEEVLLKEAQEVFENSRLSQEMAVFDV